MNYMFTYHSFVDPELIIKESEDFYRMVKTIKRKAYQELEKFLKIFTFFPHIIDVTSFLIFKLRF